MRRAREAAGLAPEQRGPWARAFRRSALRAFDDRLRRALGGRREDGDGLGATEFSGSLAALSVTDLAQALALGRRDGVIAVAHDGVESRLWCRDGEIVDAESGRLSGEAAVYHVFTLEQGHVSAELYPVRRERTVRRSTAALLLESARRKDEREMRLGRFAQRRLVRGPTAGAPSGLDRAQEALLAALTVPRSAAELLRCSELDEHEALVALVALVDARLVVFADEAERTPSTPAAALSLHPALEPGGPARRRARRAGLAALAGGGLALAGASLWWRADGGADAPAPSTARARGADPQRATGPTQGAALAPNTASTSAALAPNTASTSAALAPNAALPFPPSAPALDDPGRSSGARGPAAPAAPATSAAPRDSAAALTPGAGAPATLTLGLPAAPAPGARTQRSSRLAHAGEPDRDNDSGDTAAARLTPRMRIIEEHVPKVQILE